MAKFPNSPIRRFSNSIIAPGATIGILGGGQLGRMLAIAAAEMGYHVHIYCPEKSCPASEVARHTTVAKYDDKKALKKFAKTVDVITYEFENIPAEPIAKLAKHALIRPSVAILALSQHRMSEKKFLQKLGIETAPFAAVTSAAGLKTASKKIGLPAVLKTATMGYDGKGQWMVKSHESKVMSQLVKQCGLSSDDSRLMTHDIPFILEGFVDFTMEISVIVARDVAGKIKCYCPVQNIHKHHILAETIAPAPIAPALAAKAESIAATIAKSLKLVGIMAVEMFVTNDGKILVNELAPRPHNSGHWTIDAAVTSQFSQTIRAICGLPLGDTKRLSNARMINLIGDDIKQWKKHAANPNAKVHLYGKKESRPGRKMGHVTELKP